MKRNEIKRRGRHYGVLEPYLYLFPAFLLIIGFVYYPFFISIIKSFFLTDSLSRIKNFVGLENFVRVFSNATFLKSIGNTFKFTIFSVPLSIGVAFILAMLASKKRKFSPLYETFFSLPMAMSSSVSAMIFELMFNVNIGVINRMLGLHIDWLNNVNTAIWVLIVIRVWMNLGYNYLFILSAIRGLPQSVLEYAELDGAGPFTKATKIVLPLVSPTVFFLFCNSLAHGLTMSNLSLILTETGGPAKSTETMISFMYKATAASSNYNTAYPVAVIAFMISLMAIIITFTYEKKGVHYN